MATSERRIEGSHDRPTDVHERPPEERHGFDSQEENLAGQSDGELLQRCEF